MAFPLYLSYLTTEQKSAAACFVPQGGHPARPTASAKTMEGAPVPVVPMDCYEDMFHEIAKKFYGEGALPVQGSENGSGGAPSAQGLATAAAQSELGLMDLDYQQVFFLLPHIVGFIFPTCIALLLSPFPLLLKFSIP